MVSPDGRRFLVHSVVREDTSPIIVISQLEAPILTRVSPGGAAGACSLSMFHADPAAVPAGSGFGASFWGMQPETLTAET